MMPKDDLFFNSKSYKEVLENSNFKVLDTEENLKASFDNIRKAVTSASAAA